MAKKQQSLKACQMLTNNVTTASRQQWEQVTGGAHVKGRPLGGLPWFQGWMAIKMLQGFAFLSFKLSRADK